MKFWAMIGACSFLLLFGYFLVNLADQYSSAEYTTAPDQVSFTPPMPVQEPFVERTRLVDDDVEEFRRIGQRYGTDKVFPHAYHSMYGLYLGRVRTRNLTLLEIGLGCDMKYGPGRSLSLWREYLPNSAIHILEYNGTCAKRLESRTDKLYIGDQSNMTLLKQIADGGRYDVIVDDGGHTRKQQVHSLIGLWPALKSRGIYVIEDMFTTVEPNSPFLDLSISTVKVMEYFIYRFNNVRFPLDLYQANMDQIYASLLSVNCFHEACVLVKK